MLTVTILLYILLSMIEPKVTLIQELCMGFSQVGLAEISLLLDRKVKRKVNLNRIPKNISRLEIFSFTSIYHIIPIKLI